MQIIEITNIDRRYENLRLKDKRKEKQILDSIIETGVQSPTLCVCTDNSATYLMLDGFKRLRSLIKIKESIIPIVLLSKNVAEGIIKLMRKSGESSLKILEEASFITELHLSYGMNNLEIAKQVGHSPSWVSVRKKILEEMSEYVKQEIFDGRFPIRSYMYSLRKFTRVNNIDTVVIDDFVRAVSGKGLSTRQIEILAKGYFNGSNEIKEQIQNGSIDYTLKNLNFINGVPSGSQKEISSKNIAFIISLKQLLKNFIKINEYLEHEKSNYSRYLKQQISRLKENIILEYKVFIKKLGAIDD